MVERYDIAERWKFLKTTNDHNPIIFICLDELVDNSLFVEVFMKSLHFPSIFDSIIEDNNSPWCEQWSRKIKKFSCHPKCPINKNTIKSPRRNIRNDALWMSTNKARRSRYKSRKNLPSISEIKRKLRNILLINIWGHFRSQIRWKKSNSTIVHSSLFILHCSKGLEILPQLFKCMTRTLYRSNMSFWTGKSEYHRGKTICRTYFENACDFSWLKGFLQKSRRIPGNIWNIALLPHFSHFFEKKSQFW